MGLSPPPVEQPQEELGASHSPAEKPTRAPRSGDSNTALKPSPALFANAKKPVPQTAKHFHPPEAPTKESTDSSKVSAFTTHITYDANQANGIRRTINQWLAKKGIELVFGETDAQYDGSNRRFAEVINTSSGNSRFSEIKIVEDTGDYFTTVITMRVSPQSNWLDVNVSSVNGTQPRAPAFVKDIANRGAVDNAPPGWHTEPVQVDSKNVTSFIEYLESSNRRLPLFAIGTSPDPQLAHDFKKSIQVWNKYIVGTAALVFLDPDATNIAATRLGAPLAPPTWAIRTYLPNVKVDSAIDARRHRILGQSRIDSDGGNRTASRLGWIAEEASLPSIDTASVRDARSKIEAARNRVLLKGELYRDRVRSRSIEIIERTPEPSTTHGLLSRDEALQAHLLRELLGFEKFTEDNVLEVAGAFESYSQSDIQVRLEELLSQVEESELKVQEQSDELRYFGELESELSDRIDMLEKQSAYLRKALTEHGAANEAHSYSQVEDVLDDVDTFEELIETLAELEQSGVFFTGDENVAIGLDDIDGNGKAIKAAVRSIRAIMGYIRAKSFNHFSGSLSHYLDDCPPGYYSVSARMHASSESAPTMAEFGRLRSFPVPTEVRSDGSAEMTAHFRLARIGMKSPRLHYFDDSAKSGSIFIGYIGPHLRTVGTN